MKVSQTTLLLVIAMCVLKIGITDGIMEHDFAAESGEHQREIRRGDFKRNFKCGQLKGYCERGKGPGCCEGLQCEGRCEHYNPNRGAISDAFAKQASKVVENEKAAKHRQEVSDAFKGR